MNHLCLNCFNHKSSCLVYDEYNLSIALIIIYVREICQTNFALKHKKNHLRAIYSEDDFF